MWPIQIWKCSVLFILFSKGDGCSNETIKKPVVAALLDLHKGENCETVNLHGVQQLAGLQGTLEHINLGLLPNKIEINLQFFDTCSTTKGTRIATLRALVAAEQTCMYAPLFLGFIGNEKRANFEVSQTISKIFNFAQVLPHSFGWDFNPIDNVHFISSYPVQQHSEALRVLLTKLEIHNVITVYENTLISKMKVDHLFNTMKKDICFLKSEEFVNVDALKIQLEQGFNEDALLLVIEDVNILDTLSKFFKKYVKQIIISSGSVGFQNSLFSVVKPTYILQFISSIPFGDLSQQYNEELEKLYNDQQLSKCSKNMDMFKRKCNSTVVPASRIRDKDWTVDLLQYGLILYGHSFQSAVHKNCKQIGGGQGLCSRLNSLPQKQWNSFLRESSAIIKTKFGSSNENLHFNMNIGGKFAVYIFDDGIIQKVGEIEGKTLILYDNYKLEAMPGTANQCLSHVPTTQLPPGSLPEPTPDNGFFVLDAIGDYELIGVLSGITFGIVFLLSIFVYAVYSTVKVKSIRSDSSSRGSVHSRASE